MHRRQQAGLKLFRDGPLGDGIDLEEDILERNSKEGNISDSDIEHESPLLTWQEGGFLDSIFKATVKDDDDNVVDDPEVIERGASESSPLLPKAAASGPSNQV